MKEQNRDDGVDAEAMFAAWAVRVEGGETLDFEDLVRAHAAVETELRRLHEDWRLFAPILGRVVPGLIASDSGIVVPSLSRGPDTDDDALPSADLLARLGIHAPSEGRYRFRAVIGRGGGGVVLKVWDTKLNRPLAMKVVLGKGEERPSGDTPRVDGRTLTRFVDEARIASQLNHPGIVPVHELGADDTGRAFFTMKLVKGEDLARIFDKVERGEDGWNEPRALAVLLRVCEAMAYAHDRGVIHRDLKPANVMVGAYGEVHVMDWGLARVLGEKDARNLRIRPPSTAPVSAVDSIRTGDREATPDSPLVTMDGAVIGTPSYMAPEQARGEIERVDARSDVYAVGAMFYHLIARTPPYVARGAHVPQHVVLANAMHGPPRRVEELAPRATPELVAICEKAMQRESEQRYPSMRELADDVRAFLEGRVVRAHETGTWAETKKWVTRNKALAGSVAVAVTLLVGGLTASMVFEARADERARVARQNQYYAAIVGAQAAMRVDEPATVQRLLEEAPEELRNWEWAYLSARSDTSLLKLAGHRSGLCSAAFSPDGLRILTASHDGSARIWDANTGKELARFEAHAHGINSASYSSDGLRVVTASSDRTASVWDAISGARLVRFEGHMSLVSSAAFSPDGSRVITASWDTTARVWDATTGRELVHLAGDNTGSLHSATFSPDGSRIVTTSVGTTAVVWDATSGKELARLKGHTDEVYWAAFSADGSRIVTASRDKSTRVWDATSCAELVRLEGHTGGVTSAGFSPDGLRIATASWDATVRVWDATSGKELVRFEGHAGAVRSAAFSPDGSCVVTASSDSTARVWDARINNDVLQLRGHRSFVMCAAFDAAGSHIVTASDDHTASVWEATTGKLLANLEGHSGSLSTAAFSPDGARIVTASYDSTARVWDATSGKEILRLHGHMSPMSSAAFSPDGSRIVTASWDTTASVWDAMTGKELTRLRGSVSSVSSAAFSSDGLRIVTGSIAADSIVRVWDAASGAELTRFEGVTDGVSSVAFSADDSRIVTASSDKIARVWNVASGAVLAQLEGHTSWLGSALFSPDGSRIVTASGDGTARVWDATSGKELARLEGHTAQVHSAAFSPDGLRIVTASDDGTARVWDSVSYAVRRVERQSLAGVSPRAECELAASLARATSVVEAGRLLRRESSLEHAVKRVALDLLLVRADAARRKARALESKQNERTWVSRMLGREPWPSESEMETLLSKEKVVWSDPVVCNELAWSIVAPGAQAYGDEIRALVLASRSVAVVDPVCIAERRDTLARALFRVGQFDAALKEQRMALLQAPISEQPDYEKYLACLESDITEWRDESGNLRVAEHEARIEELTRGIEALESDSDVQLWLGTKR